MQYDEQKDLNHWKTFFDGLEMPKGFEDSSWNQDVFPSIELMDTKFHDTENSTIRVRIVRVHIFFQSIESALRDFDWEFIQENMLVDGVMPKYFVRMHETEDVYTSNDYDDSKYSELYTNDWNEVLNAIKSFNNLNMLNEFVITDKTTDQFIEKFADLGQDFGQFYLSIGIDMRDGLDYFDMNDLFIIACEMRDQFHSESQFKYVTNYLTRFSDIWESKDI